MKQLMAILMLLVALTMAVPAALAEGDNEGSGSADSEMEQDDDAADTESGLQIEASVFNDVTLFEVDQQGDETYFEADTPRTQLRATIIEDVVNEYPSLTKEQVDAALEIVMHDRLATPQDREQAGDDEADDADAQVEVNAEADVEVQTQTQVEDMLESTHGSQMRLLQLKHQLERRVVQADAVISYLDNKSTNQTTVDKLQSIRDDINALIPEVDAAMDNSDTAVQTFLDVKEKAKGLVKEFKETARTVLKQSDVDGLGKVFSQLDKTKFTDIEKQIKEQREELNSERVASLMSTMGVQAQALAEQVRNGEITPEEARKQLKDLFDQLNAAQKEKVAQVLAEREAKMRVERADKVRKEKQEQGQRLAEIDARIEARTKEEQAKMLERLKVRQTNDRETTKSVTMREGESDRVQLPAKEAIVSKTYASASWSCSNGLEGSGNEECRTGARWEAIAKKDCDSKCGEGGCSMSGLTLGTLCEGTENGRNTLTEARG